MKTHINTTSFTNVASQSVNNVFSTEYDNYKIEYNIFHTSTTTDLLMRFRTGSDDTGTNYTAQRFFYSNTTASGGRESATSRIRIGQVVTNPQNVGTVTVYSPNKNTRTATHTEANNGDTDATVAIFTGINFQATQFTGFTVFAGTGNITGALSVYGLRN